MRKPKYLVSGALSEQTIQLTVMEWVRAHPKLNGLVFHIPNEGNRPVHYKKLLVDMGMRSGVADLFIAMAAHGYHGCWIELKSAKGRLSREQKDFLDDMQEQGYFTAVVYNINEAIEIIKYYCL